MKNIVRIVAAVVDTHNLVLYKQDGTTIEIPQGDARVKRIITEATPLIINQGYADVDISHEYENSYASFEKESKGLVKFFRVAKEKLKNLFGGDEPVETQTVGVIPPSPASKMQSAIDDILQHATPVSSGKFHEHGLDNQKEIVNKNGYTPKEHTSVAASETIIAVVDDKVIPGVEKIKNQFTKAAKMGSTVGVENFLKRVGEVIKERKHTVDDLLKFMERGDLPIADDGSILVYKVLKRVDGQYVDCHTKKVKQFVGAYVCMDKALVDPNRNNECSNGLHIARRGYLNQFSGDVCVLCKLAPEDVITVPAYDANKMRVSGYHIIAELTQSQYDLLNRNKPLTDDPKGAILLANAIKGIHVNKTHEVRITLQQGNGVITTVLDKEVVPEIQKDIAPVEALVNQEDTRGPVVNPLDVVTTIQKTKRELAQELSKAYRDTPTQENLDALMNLKRTSKVSWDRLGIPAPASLVQAEITAKASTPKAPNKAKVSRKAEAATKAKEEAKNVTSKQTDSQATPQTSRIVNGVELGLGSYRERIRKLIPCTSVGSARAILELKKRSKKSWAFLGFSEEESKAIIALASQDK